MSNTGVPQILIDTLCSKECLLFIGSGISTWSGAPTWKKLLIDFCEFLEYKGLCNLDSKKEILKNITADELLLAASFCKSLTREADFAEFIGKEFVNKNFLPHEIHEIILTLGPDCFITTNYDNLIETEYQRIHNGLMLRAINNNQPIEQASIQKASTSKFIFKPHGNMLDSNTIIMTQEDYRKLRVNMESTIETFKHLLIQRPVIYLGFGLKDPTFLLVKDYIAETYTGGDRQHFAIMSDISSLQKDFWYKSYGITLVNYDVIEKQEMDTITSSKVKAHSHENLLFLLKHIKSEILKQNKPVTQNITTEAKLSLLRYCDSVVYEFNLKGIKPFEISGSIVKMGSDYKDEIILSKALKNIPIIDAVNQFEKITIIGAPGTGKSISLEYYAQIVASNSRTINGNFPKHSIPILLAFKEYRGSILEMIRSKLPASIDKDATLKEGLFSIIVDALNEAPKEYFDNKILENDISSFLTKYPGNKFIFSARTESYTTFLNYPLFKIVDLNYSVISTELKARGLESEDLPYEVYEMLSNPFLFSLFIKSGNKDARALHNSGILLREYFKTTNLKIKEYGFDIDVIEVFGEIAYKITEFGEITTSPEMIYNQFSKTKISKPEIVLNILFSIKFLLPDSEGKVGFMHQTILEYLAASHLRPLFLEDKTIINEKLDNKRWDETIILFTSILDRENFSEVLKRIVDRDIFYAFSIYKKATILSLEVEQFLLNELFDRLKQQDLISSYKQRLAYLLNELVIPKQYKSLLSELKDDKELSENAILALAKMGAQEIIPFTIDKLLKGSHSWINNYSRALILLNNPQIPYKLISKVGKIKVKEDDSLIYNNVSTVLSHYQSTEMLAKLKKLSFSKAKRKRILFAEITADLQFDDIKEIYNRLLDDSDEELRSSLLSSLSHYAIWQEGNCYYQPIVDKCFDILRETKTGTEAMRYLEFLKSDMIYNRAKEELENAEDDLYRIKLANLIKRKDEKQANQIFLHCLHNYKPEYQSLLLDSLYMEMDDVLREEVLALLSLDNDDLNLFIVSCFMNISEDITSFVAKKTFDRLFNLWKTKIISRTIVEENWHLWVFIFPKFLGFCRGYSKDKVLPILNDEKHELREQVLAIAAYAGLTKADVTDDVLEWLLEVMSREKRFLSNAKLIVGEICDEKLIKDRIQPLLKSNNSILRENAYSVIEDVERKLNKRLIQK